MKINATKWITLCVAVLALVVLASPVQATSLGTPLPVGAPPVVPVTVGLPAGSIVGASTATITASSFTGTLTFAVWKETVSGLLDFLYQVTNNAGSIDNIGRVTMADFTGFTTSVSYALAGTQPAGFVAGTVKSLSADRNTADTVGWGYAASGNPITPGSTTGVMVICTNATLFTDGGIVSYINRSVTSNSAFQPFAQTQRIPEPTSVVLLASCFLGVGSAYAWRRWKGVPTPA